MKKTKICRLCQASFVPETKNQEYCNECTKHTSQVNPKHTLTHRKSTKRGKNIEWD